MEKVLRREGKFNTLNLYTIYWSENNYYLIGPNPEMFIQDFIEKSVNHFSGESVRIEVEYEPSQITNAILYDFAGSSVNVRKLENGKCRAIFTKLDSVTLTGWFMQYANMFKVVGTATLVEDIKSKLELARQNYSN